MGQNYGPYMGKIFRCRPGSNRYVKRIKVGNKIDQEEHREVGRHEAERYAEQNNCTYFETSAKDSTGINEAFESGTVSLFFYFNSYKGSGLGKLSLLILFYFC